MTPTVRVLLAAFAAFGVFAAAFGITVVALNSDDEPAGSAERTSETTTTATPTDTDTDTGTAGEKVKDVAELCALVNDIHADAPDDEDAQDAYLRDELVELSRNSTPELQSVLGRYIKGISWRAQGPEPGQEALEAMQMILEGRERLNDACIAAGAPGYG